MSEDINAAIAMSGFQFANDLIHTFVGGSSLHGAKVQGTDDTDWYGLYIEPPKYVVGLHTVPHFVWSTSGDHARNCASDVDCIFYGLRKWAGMIAKGNPTALNFLFAESYNESTEWVRLRDQIKPCVLVKSAAKQFRGFADAQMGRLLGTRGQGKKGQRPELEETFGFDVKAGMHTVRLLMECIELMNSGTITFPRPERELLIRIRTGEWSLDKLSSHVNLLFEKLKDAEAESVLPATADRERLSAVITSAYLRHWEGRSSWRG